MSGKDNVISLASKTERGKMWSVEDMLKDLIADKERLGDYNKAVVLLLNDDGQYTTGFNQAGMVMSECILLCEMAKDDFKVAMGRQAMEV
jgi:hypothetical protein